MLSIIFLHLLFLATTVSSRTMVKVLSALINMTYWITFLNFEVLYTFMFIWLLPFINLINAFYSPYSRCKSHNYTTVSLCFSNVWQKYILHIVITQLPSHFTFFLLQNCFLFPLNHIWVHGKTLIVSSQLSFL